MRNIKFKCRYFDGSKPCRFRRVCMGCTHYEPVNKRILVIKLASPGDVLRTTVVLPALKKKYPDSHITWLTKGPAEELLEGNPLIDRILVYGLKPALLLQLEKFDLVISLDKAVEAAAIATLVNADEKCGFGLDGQGKIYPFNKEAEYSFTIGLDDNLKFYKNTKSYQEMVFEICGLKYNGSRYELGLGRKELDFASNFLKKNKINKQDIIIGINTGSGKIFANKNLSPARITELIKLLKNEINAELMLLGGPLERGINRNIIKTAGARIIDGGCDNSLKEFSALVNTCAVVITADTLALHIAVALKKPVVALFGPTCHQEIELYGCGRKVVTRSSCAPCYKNECGRKFTCMDDVNLNEVVTAAKTLINPKTMAKK